MTKVIKPQSIKTELTISNAEFKDHLESRIKIGSDLLEKTITNQSEIAQLVSESNSWSDYNSEYLKQSFNNPYNEYRQAYENSSTYWGGIVGPSEPQPKRQQIIIQNQITNLENLISKSGLIKSSMKNTTSSINQSNKLEVFIVHGHDEVAESKTARFIERLGLTPIILHEQSSGGKTIIEKIEQYSNVGFGIVLYTACDLGGKTKGKRPMKSSFVFDK